MARIEINDLPEENLSPEQEEQLKGAGLKSYRPTLDALEDRQLMAANLAGSIMPPPARHFALEHAPQAQAPANDVVLVQGTGQALSPNTDAMPRSLAANQQSDTSTLKQHAESFLKDKIIGNGLGNGAFSNRWTLNHKGMYLSSTSQAGNSYVLDFKVWHGSGGGEGATVRLTFQAHMDGGERVFTLTGAGLHDYPGAFGGSFESVAKELFKNNYSSGIRVTKFNPNENLVNHSAAESRLVDSVKDYLKQQRGDLIITGSQFNRTADGFSVTFNIATRHEKWEIDTNPNFKKQINRSSITLTFRYDGMADGVAQYSCVKVESKISWNGTSNVRDERWDGSLSDIGGLTAEKLQKQFSTQKKDQAAAPDLVAHQAFADSQKILSGLKYKDFKMNGYQELGNGVRVNFQAVGPDGQLTNFSLHIQYEGPRGYRCVRATDNFDSLTSGNAQGTSTLDKLAKDLHGSWQRPQDAAVTGPRVLEQAQQVLGRLGVRNFEHAQITPIEGGVRIYFIGRTSPGDWTTIVKFTIDIKFDSEHAYHCHEVNIQKYDGITPEQVAAMKHAINQEVRLNQ